MYKKISNDELNNTNINNKKSNAKNKKIIVSIIITLIITAILSTSYAFFYYRKALSDITLNSGEIAINFDDTNNTFSSISNYPKKDVFGKIDSNYYDFSVSGKVIDEVIYYEIQIKEESNNTLDPRYIKVYLTDQNDNSIVEPVLLSNLDINSYNNNHIVYKSHILEDNQIDKYRLRIWVDESYTESTAKTFQFKVNLYARNGEESINNVYTVTFDANGGSVDLHNKKVLYNSKYGYLPTPTKEGYTFLGWHGKNIFNPDVMILSNETHVKGTEEITLNPGVYDRILNKSRWEPKLDTTYTLILEIIENTFSGSSLNLRADSRFYIDKYNNATVYSISSGTTGKQVIPFTTRENFENVTLGSFWFLTSNSITGTFRTKIAIFEGTAYTDYEPYYITSRARVVQNNNHTLTAIWQANS